MKRRRAALLVTPGVLLIASALATAPTAGRALDANPGAAGDDANAAAVERRPGPRGSLVLVEPNHALPLVHVVVALRSGSAWDPHKKEGLALLAAETARRGAAGQSRERLDARLDALGAALDVRADADTLGFEGEVLSRHLDDYLAVIADVLLRPAFAPAEVARARRELIGRIDDDGNDDAALAARFFTRNLYGDHPYGYPPEGTRASLGRVEREDLQAWFHKHVVAGNVIFAAGGDVQPDAFAAAVTRAFAALPAGAPVGANPLAAREPQAPRGWRIQIVDKPDRQQAQILFGQLAVPATDPDFVPLLVAATSFGGRGMKATMMDEIRTKRSLAYGAYMNLSERAGRGALFGSVWCAAEKAVPTLKLALKLYVGLMDRRLDPDRLAFAKNFLTGTQAAALDDPRQRLDARVAAEVVGLPPRFVDELGARIGRVTAAEIDAAIARRVHAHDLAITVVATAATLRPLLIDAKIQPSAIDVVPYDGF